MADAEDKIYCIDVGVYEKHLTLFKTYLVCERDSDKGQTKIKGNTGKKVWIPNTCLNESLTPEFELSLESDHWEPDPNWNPKNDFMNIGITLPDCRVFSLNVWTYDFFQGQVQEERSNKESDKASYISPPDLFVEELTREAIHAVVTDLLRKDDKLDEYLPGTDFDINFKGSWISGFTLEDLGESLVIKLKELLPKDHFFQNKEIEVEAKRKDSEQVLFSYDFEKLAWIDLADPEMEIELFYTKKQFWQEKF